MKTPTTLLDFQAMFPDEEACWEHLHRYLDELVYRFDRRWKEKELFGFVMRRALGGEPFPYHRLVADVHA